MKNKILSIDFEIIWKSIHDSLDDDEELLLDKWLAEDNKHKAYYQKAKQYYHQERPELVTPDVEAFWESKPDVDRNPMRWMLVSVAASIVLIIASLIVIPRLAQDEIVQEVAQNKEVQLNPGGKKAILHLGSGKKVTLGSGNKFQTNANGALIQVTGETIRYSDEYGAASESSEMHTIEVPKGGEFMLMLSDSTKVWINSASTLTYPSHFNGDKRVVELTGEAYFEVAHRSDQRFEVVTAGQTITVLGTSFNVNYYPEDKNIISTLVNGKVRIDTEEGSNTILSPGEQAIYNKENKAITKQKVDVENFIAWKNGLFYFDNESLERIMIILSRWYDIKVIYNNPDLKELRFTGTLKRYDSFDHVIDLIEMTNDVKFKKEENVITIE